MKDKNFAVKQNINRRDFLRLAGLGGVGVVE